MDLSVIIPCYNSADTLGEQLEALAEQEWSGSWEVIVADNGSTDASKEIVQRYHQRLPGLRLLDASDKKRSSGHARNVGAAAARGEAVAFVDADDVVAPGWVAAIGKALAEHEFVASRHETRRLNPEWLVQSRGEVQFDGLQQIWYPPYLAHAGGCGLGVRRRLFETHGGFDADLQDLQDTDICFRLQRAGVELVFVPDATVHIRFRAGQRPLFRQARRWAEYNDLMYKRHRPTDVRIPHPWREYWKRWRRILRRVRGMRDRRVRHWVVWQVGWQVGLLIGSLKYRVAPAVHVAGTTRSLPAVRVEPSHAGPDGAGARLS